MLLSRFTLSLLALTTFPLPLFAQTPPETPAAPAPVAPAPVAPAPVAPAPVAPAPVAPAPVAPAPVAPENMVLIAGGEGWMGTDDADSSNENQRDNVPLNANDARPRHRVKVAPFFLDKTMVTCAQYKKFCDATGTPAPPDWNGGAVPTGKADFPVFRVNWYEASAFANWAGKRLPNESEWERAARGEEGRIYPWGNDWDPSKLVWDSGGPRAVGSKPEGASPQGVLDLAGNGFEWTSSWFDAYPGAPVKVPEFGQSLKVVRGGGWRGADFLPKGWYRGVNRPQSRIEWVGFRCAKDTK
ncbi:iron(II)-dependent oxidoreductase [Abditibacterium utsteinense]|uniref:Iron(II)-dependent oxidoreductase n=1 Tax=Abditibacterium utsteinense TaxID=1960156 RepID=A0A2S8SVT0_9BACT|nr:SUMF1/EgtB/PvdO family nonheme iron enzyme [Abditibacterium utsteinense]PQV64892.1 iron(II)-dependent oxidoreductase [Abditibacterium utsteinense]